MKFNYRYLITAILIFLIEIIIALFAHDNFIRPHLGDVLVVILIYCFVKAFFDLPVYTVAIGTLLFSYAVEVSQYYELVNKLGLQYSRLAKIIFGTTFSWWDIVAYTTGIVLVVILEKRCFSK